jgi:hypothetical protein
MMRQLNETSKSLAGKQENR